AVPEALKDLEQVIRPVGELRQPAQKRAHHKEDHDQGDNASHDPFQHVPERAQFRHEVRRRRRRARRRLLLAAVALRRLGRFPPRPGGAPALLLLARFALLISVAAAFLPGALAAVLAGALLAAALAGLALALGLPALVRSLLAAVALALCRRALLLGPCLALGVLVAVALLGAEKRSGVKQA